MSKTTSRGRPALSPLVKQEKQVAKAFAEADRLNTELEQSLVKAYPQLNPGQRAEIRHTVLGVSEEYRLWSSIDNTLLALQRRRGSTPSVQAHTSKLRRDFDNLIGLYFLYTTSRGLTPLPELSGPVTESWPNLSGLAVGQQSLELQRLANWLNNATGKIPERSELISLRRHTRALLIVILRERLSLVWPNPDASGPGRPELPLPVRYIRAEQALIDASLVLHQLCQQNHLPMLPPKSLSIKHQVKTRAGRPKLTGRQRLQRTLTNKQKQLEELTRQAPGKHKPKGPGRRPLSPEEKATRLKESISLLKQQLSMLTD